jgi:lycopene cyclase domain-containing protein
MHYAYLWLDLVLFCIVVALAVWKRELFAGEWRWVYPAVLFPSILFLIWDAVFIRLGVWSINRDRITQNYLYNIPWEEVGLFLAIPLLCLLIYEGLRTAAKGYGSKAEFTPLLRPCC